MTNEEKEELKQLRKDVDVIGLMLSNCFSDEEYRVKSRERREKFDRIYELEMKINQEP